MPNFRDAAHGVCELCSRDVKAICTFCGHRNRGDAQTCAQCGGSLADARREQFRVPWASWVPAIPLAAVLFFQHSQNETVLAEARRQETDNSSAVTSRTETAARELRERYEKQEAELESKHRAMLADARLISGEEARARHADEWQRRQNHDPAFAASVMEKTLLEVERLGKDSSLTAEAALQKAAEMVTPPGSRIEVSDGSRGFVVRVAFRLSAVDPNEAGGGTIRTSPAEIRKEIEDVTAHVIKDLFEYTGARGIERVSVSCNRALVTGKEGAERLEMRSLYRASVDGVAAGDVSNWRQLSISQVEAMMKVEHDVLATLVITRGGATGLTLDPNEPLEF
jgi:hypothetical protein